MTDEKQGGGGLSAGPERELKFIADRRTLKAALAAPLLGGEAGPPRWKKLKTVYFNSEARDLAHARVALRVRRVEGDWIMGLKRTAPNNRGAFDREETEVVAPSGEPDLALFDKAVAREVEVLTGAKPLTPQFGSDIRRTARTIRANGAMVEVAFDQGFLFSEEKRAPIAELDSSSSLAMGCSCSTSASRWWRPSCNSAFRARPYALMRC